MANVRNSNSVYVDSTGSLITTPVKLHYVIFTPDAANDQLILKDRDSSGDLKLSLRGVTAKQTLQFDFSNAPIHFPNGLYVSTITSGATATLVGSN